MFRIKNNALESSYLIVLIEGCFVVIESKKFIIGHSTNNVLQQMDAVLQQS